MGFGTGAAGFGAGFARGFTNSYMAKKQREREDTRIAEDRKLQQFKELNPFMIDKAEQTGDWRSYQDFYLMYHPEMEKEFKKNGNPFEGLLPQSGVAPKPTGDQAQMVDEQSSALAQSGQPVPIPSRNPVQAQAQPDYRSYFLGSPMPTLEQKAELEGMALGRRGVAQRLVVAKAAQELVNKGAYKDLPSAIAFLDGEQGRAGSAGSWREGEITKDPNTGKWVQTLYLSTDPTKTMQIPAMDPQARAFGALAERAATDLGFATAAEAAAAGKMADVNKRVQELRAAEGGAVTGAQGEARAKAPLSTEQRFTVLARLQDDWRKAEAPVKEMDRQLKLMETGLERFNAGDKNGGSQAVLVTFQKILDPNSVVREAEYARTSQGLGLLTRLEGAYNRLKEGGAGVPPEELAAMVETARQFVAGMADYNALERERISGTAKDAGLQEDRIFGTAKVTSGGGAKPQAAPAGSNTDTAVYDPKTKKWTFPDAAKR